MSTRSTKSAESELLKEIKSMRADMLTAKHFDEKMEPINAKLELHDEQISDMSNRLKKVETTKEDYADAVYDEMHEQEKRKSSVVIFTLEEQNQQLPAKDIFKKDKLAVKSLFTDMKLLDPSGDNINMRVSRVGQFVEGKTRPLRVVLSNQDVKYEVLGAAKNLKGNTKWRNVSIACDLTKTQQKLAKKKRSELMALVAMKNSERSGDEINQGVEYKMVGNYGRFNLRMIKVSPTTRAVSSDEEEG